MAASTSHDLWLCYQRYMDLHRRAQDLPIRNLMRAEAQICLDAWFKAIKRELRAEAQVAASNIRQPAYCANGDPQCAPRPR